MSLRNLSPLFALVTGLVIASCTPYPENQPQAKPQPPADPAKNPTATMSAEEQEKLKEERKKAAEEAEKKAADQDKRTEDGGSGTAGTGDSGSGSKKPAGERKDYPFASPVPGKAGFVFSPYNNKVIDVRDIPSGTLVQDPTYPASEKKNFRVP